MGGLHEHVHLVGPLIPGGCTEPARSHVCNVVHNVKNHVSHMVHYEKNQACKVVHNVKNHESQTVHSVKNHASNVVHNVNLVGFGETRAGGRVQVEGRLVNMYLESKSAVINEMLEEYFTGDGTPWVAAPVPTSLRDVAFDLVNILVRLLRPLLPLKFEKNVQKCRVQTSTWENVENS